MTPVPARSPAVDAAGHDGADGALKVLISAYSCTPGAGSERGIGWNTASEMAKRHEVWVLTRKAPNQYGPIQRELTERPIPSLHVVYYDLPKWLAWAIGVQASSYLWQIVVYRVVRRLHREIGFDLAHHVSWVRYYTPSPLAFLSIPFVWGPIGGGDSMPKSFRRGLRMRARIAEFQRRLIGRLAALDPLVRLTARRSTITLANSHETAERVAALGASRIRIFGESGVDRWVLAYASVEPEPPTGPVCFASLTRLVHWKGVHLGLQAFARLEDRSARYWIVGEGPEEARLRGMSRELGVADRVDFLPNLSRDEWMERLRRCDALVHPCIYNSGSAISLEAMAMARPVICLDRGGIRDQVTNDVGFRVRAETAEEAITGLAEAMRKIVARRDLVATLGLRGRERVLRHFSWEARGAELERVYDNAISFFRLDTAAVSDDRLGTKSAIGAGNP